MSESLQNAPVLGFLILLASQLFTFFLIWSSIRQSHRERLVTDKELYGLIRRVEGMTASKQEQVLLYFDELLEGMHTKLPLAIAEEAAGLIRDVESNILSKISHIELSRASQNREQAEHTTDLMLAVESLESTVQKLTANAVHNIMSNTRRHLFSPDKEKRKVKVIDLRKEGETQDLQCSN